jgi:Arf-GAP domain and FG repeat-containing protein 1
MYVVLNFGIFVCSACSGVHRELLHKVKGLGMCNFNDTETEFLKKWGNQVRVTMLIAQQNAKDYWMAEHNKTLFPVPDRSDPNRMKDFLKMKY